MIQKILYSKILENEWQKSDVRDVAIALMKKYNDCEGHMYGLAANQLKWRFPVFLIKWFKTDKLEIVVQPSINWKFGSKNSLEGCLSCDKRYIVKRPLLAKVSYLKYDMDTDELSSEIKLLTFKNARRFFHEYDHLLGRTIEEGILWKQSY